MRVNSQARAVHVRYPDAWEACIGPAPTLVASGCESWPDICNRYTKTDTPKLTCSMHTHLPKAHRKHLPLEPVGRAQELPPTRGRVHLRQEVVPAPCTVAQSTSISMVPSCNGTACQLGFLGSLQVWRECGATTRWKALQKDTLCSRCFI